MFAVDLGSHRGKQEALLAGFALARHPFVLTMNGDLQDDPAAIDRLLAVKRESGARAVIGARLRRAEGALKVWPSRALNALARRRFGLTLEDINSPVRLVDRELVQGLRLRHNEFRFLPVLWAQAGHRVLEVPVSQRPRCSGKSKFRGPWRFIEALFILATLPRRQRRSQWKTAVFRAVVTAAALAVAWRLVEGGGTHPLASELSWTAVALVAAANALVLLVKALRWRAVLGAWGVYLGRGDAFCAYLTGSLFGALTPGRFGTFARSVYVLCKTRAAVSTALASVVVDRGLDVLVLGVLAMPALGARWSRGAGGQATLALGALALAVGVVALFRVHPDRGVEWAPSRGEGEVRPLWSALALSWTAYSPRSREFDRSGPLRPARSRGPSSCSLRIATPRHRCHQVRKTCCRGSNHEPVSDRVDRRGARSGRRRTARLGRAASTPKGTASARHATARAHVPLRSFRGLRDGFL